MIFPFCGRAALCCLSIQKQEDTAAFILYRNIFLWKQKRPRNTVTYIYSLSMGTAILINKTFLTSEYKLNSRIRHHWIGLLNAFSSGSEQNSITHILYRFSVLSSIYICVVSMNLYYILCKNTNQYNMLIHGILRILISMGVFSISLCIGNW